MPKGNPNPSPSTRFSSEDNPARGRGRQKGARDRFSAAFLDDLAETWAQHGFAALVHVATNDQSTFVKLGPALLAKEIEIRRPLDGMEDSELLQAIATLERFHIERR